MLTAALVLATAALPASDPTPPAATAATATFQGRWVAVSEERGGKDRGGRGVEVVVGEGTLAIRRRGESTRAVYLLRPTADAVEITVRYLDVEDPLALTEMKGICAMDGSRLRLCLGPPRNPPARFDSRGDPMHWLLTLEWAGGR